MGACMPHLACFAIGFGACGDGKLSRVLLAGGVFERRQPDARGAVGVEEFVVNGCFAEPLSRRGCSKLLLPCVLLPKRGGRPFEGKGLPDLTAESSNPNVCCVLDEVGAASMCLLLMFTLDRCGCVCIGRSTVWSFSNFCDLPGAKGGNLSVNSFATVSSFRGLRT